MTQSYQRMADPTKKPTPLSLSRWIGAKNFERWTQIIGFIEDNYPNVFETTWLFGGKKHGWALRFKKSKSFCTLIPEKNRFKILLVFGAKEREQVDLLLPHLVSHLREDYAAATTYHDGKWVASVVDSKGVIADIERLFLLKRNPKRQHLPHD